MRCLRLLTTGASESNFTVDRANKSYDRVVIKSSERPDMLDPQSKGHEQTRNIARAVGAVITVVALLMIIDGLSVFFNPTPGFNDMSRFIWVVLGLPALGIGLNLLFFGFLGKLVRYKANELAPVAKDAFGYIAHETKDSMRDVVRNVTQGIREGMNNVEPVTVQCHKCGAAGKPGSKFCDQCGTSLVATAKCPACNAEHDADARFCPSCGRTLSEAT